ncbi:flagellar hook-length control protein FliK [Octadecabacter antarcticus]|nr:flagellar hook-length control protein FliK [Octadecabacter antarcticus]
MTDFGALEGKCSKVDAGLGEAVLSAGAAAVSRDIQAPIRVGENPAEIALVGSYEDLITTLYSVSFLNNDTVAPVPISSELLQPSKVVSTVASLLAGDVEAFVKKMTGGVEVVPEKLNAFTFESLPAVEIKKPMEITDQIIAKNQQPTVLVKPLASNLELPLAATMIEDGKPLQALSQTTLSASIRSPEHSTAQSLPATDEAASVAINDSNLAQSEADLVNAAKVEDGEPLQALSQTTRSASIRSPEHLTAQSVLATDEAAFVAINDSNLAQSEADPANAAKVEEGEPLQALSQTTRSASIRSPEYLTAQSVPASDEAAFVAINDSNLAQSEAGPANAAKVEEGEPLQALSQTTRSASIRSPEYLTAQSVPASDEAAFVAIKDSNLSQGEAELANAVKVEEGEPLQALSQTTRSASIRSPEYLTAQSVPASDEAAFVAIKDSNLAQSEAEPANAKLDDGSKTINTFKSPQSTEAALLNTSAQSPQSASAAQVAPVGVVLKVIPPRQETANLQTFSTEPLAAISNIEVSNAGSGMQTQTGAGANGQSAMTPHQVLAVALDVRRQGWTKALVNRVVNMAQSGGTLTMNIMPAHLGQITLKLSEGRRGTDLRIVADVAATASMLRDVQQQISSAFESAGLTLGEYSAGTGKGGHGSSNPHEDDVTNQMSEIENLSNADTSPVNASNHDDRSRINILL